ncbi:LLM class flavin-dependent oxidoreductase [Roseomonas gilardii]|uniref:LLM class flavin-dependent oxidoreductase n=1 Tax=Roseomonas gilardii TaxID=257708 RepID=UPI0011A74285|nr:LLM class flavin-dependent oxidoreductase [Roseomonas gilardii]
MSQRTMRLGLSMRFLGYHAAAWRHPDMVPRGAFDFGQYREVARLAEQGCFDMLFLADSVAIRGHDRPEGSACRSAQNAELEPVTLLSALAAVTSRIGLVATASTTYNEPYHVARKFASLDHISGGRAGWNVVTSWSEAEAWNFSRESHPDYDTRYGRAAEFVDVVRGLWDSWEDGEPVADKASGIYYDPARLHALNHRGPHFSVRGPLSIPRTPQGRPLIVQAGASSQGQDIAARTADVVYSAEHELGAARDYYTGLKGRLARHGRDPGELLILPGIVPVVGRTEQEARDKFARLQDLIHPLVGLSYLTQLVGDLSAYPVDGPVPALTDDPAIRSFARILLGKARAGNQTIRQLYEDVASGWGMRVLVGDPGQIADEMVLWFREGAADGFNICPTHLPGGLADFNTLVLPELRRRGLFRTAYEGRTLRQNLGLREPANRYTAAATV